MTEVTESPGAARHALAAAFAAGAVLAGCGGGSDFALSGPDIPGGTVREEQVFDSFGCADGNISPELRWTNPPAGTKSCATGAFLVLRALPVALGKRQLTVTYGR